MFLRPKLTSDDAVVFPGQLSYKLLVLTAKTSLHYGGASVCVCVYLYVCVRACVRVCVYRRGLCVVSSVCTAHSRSPHSQSSTISQLKDTRHPAGPLVRISCFFLFFLRVI